MTEIDFKWPDESAESLRAARGRLAVASERLALRSFEDRVQAVARVVAAWSAPDSPWRRELAERLAETSPFHRDTIAEGLDSALRAWDPTRFIECARREIEQTCQEGRVALSPYASTSVLAGGSIPMPTLLSGLLPLVLGSPVLLRETSNDAVTPELLARSLAHCDADLAQCFESVRFEVEDAAAMTEFLASPCVVATGSDETIAAIRSKLSPDQRFVAYGHRFSIAVLGPGLASNDSRFDEAMRGLALDIARWDQLGCLSPVDVYLVEVSIPDAQRIADGIANALEELSTRMPRGSHPADLLATHATERLEGRMRAAVADTAVCREGADFTVLLETDARARPAPLTRLLHIYRADDEDALARLLSPLARHLSNVAIGGFDSEDENRVAGLMARLGASRVCAPGRLQTPPIDWPHDGMPVFSPMARFVQWD